MKITKFNASVMNVLTKIAKKKKIEASKDALVNRIVSAAEKGEYEITVMDINYAGHWYEIKTWLEELGFSVKRACNSWSTYYIQWDDESIAEGLK